MNRLTICLVALCATTTTPAWAQRYPISPIGTGRLNAALNDIRQEQQQNQQLQKAQREMAAREKQMIAAAAQEVSAAKVAHRVAIKEVKAAREKAKVAVEQSLGLKAALEEVIKLQTACREASEPVLHALKSSAEYQQAEKSSTAARDKLRRLQSDTSLDDQTRKSRMAELVSDSLAPSNLERAALKKDVKANAARERLDAAQQHVAELRKQAAATAEHDPGVASALAAVKAAQESVKSAEANLASVRSGGAVMQQLLQGQDAQAQSARPAAAERKP